MITEEPVGDQKSTTLMGAVSSWIQVARQNQRCLSVEHHHPKDEDGWACGLFAATEIARLSVHLARSWDLVNRVIQGAWSKLGGCTRLPEL